MPEQAHLIHYTTIPITQQQPPINRGVKRWMAAPTQPGLFTNFVLRRKYDSE
jgi:hypothetical protein